MEIKNSAENLKEKKQKIIELLRQKGPLLPSALSRELGMPLLLTSALLSDMRAEKLLRLSRLKIGGSPLYYLQGQEAQLEQFINHLPQKEKEAFELLKKAQIVDEEKVEPGHRVAFGNMKDFAFPVFVKLPGGQGEKVFWRFHSLGQEEASKRIEEFLSKKNKEAREARDDRTDKEAGKTEETKKEKPVKEKKPGLSRKKSKEEFYVKVYEHLKQLNLDVESRIDEDGVVGVVFASLPFGKAKMLVVASQKKRINEADLSLAYQQGLSKKMPVLFLTTGELTKKASEHLNSIGNYLFVKRI
ncbi:MAG: hypothetical protein K6T16_00235 [Candidatus Pacearchaeota archaeon]|nr:hypothetical protein [Candidatus Pacearchaeota archaeon]